MLLFREEGMNPANTTFILFQPHSLSLTFVGSLQNHILKWFPKATVMLTLPNHFFSLGTTGNLTYFFQPKTCENWWIVLLSKVCQIRLWLSEWQGPTHTKDERGRTSVSSPDVFRGSSPSFMLWGIFHQAASLWDSAMALVSWGCCNKVPPTWWPQTTEIYMEAT